MASTFRKQPITGGDLGVWGPKELAQVSPMVGVITARLYDQPTAGEIYLTAGVIGIDNDSVKGIIEIDATVTLDVTALTASRWAKIEVAVSGSTVTYSLTSIASASNPATLPSEFTGAHDPEKGGFYISNTKRCIGLVWINAGGSQEGLVNVRPFVNGYNGFSQSNDALDVPYHFEADITTTLTVAGAVAFPPDSRWVRKTATASYTMLDIPKNYDGLVLEIGGYDSITVTLPTVADNAGKFVYVVCNVDAAPITIDGEGAEKIYPRNRSSVFLISQGDYICLWSNGTEWQVVSYSITMDCGPINTADWTNRSLGMCQLEYDTLVGTIRIGDTVTETGGNACTGIVVAVDANTLWLRKVTGTAPGVFTNNNVLTFTGGATAEVNEPAGNNKNRDGFIDFGGGGINIEDVLFWLIVTPNTTGSRVGAYYMPMVCYDSNTGSAYQFGFNMIETSGVLDPQTAQNGFIAVQSNGTYLALDSEDYCYWWRLEVRL